MHSDDSDRDVMIEHLHRRAEVYHIKRNRASVTLKCKFCGKVFRMRKYEDSDHIMPAGIEYICAHADSHLRGYSVERH